MSILHEIIQRTAMVPVPAPESAYQPEAARQLDAALMTVGFKLAAPLFDHIATLHPVTAHALGADILQAVREQVGATVEHNVYFIDFPRNVPDTMDFWLEQLVLLFFTGDSDYGRYQHTYAEMMARHGALTDAAPQRVTILHLGGTLPEAAHGLYVQLALSPTPLNAADLALVRELATMCIQDAPPEAIPMRETRAVINAARARQGASLTIDTVTDVLRLAAALSDGDVSLQTPTRFMSFPRPLRRALLGALNATFSSHPAQLADLPPHAEMWKRLGERLHPHAYPQWPQAAAAFQVARGERQVQTLDARLAADLAKRNIAAAADLLAKKPGVFVRRVDHLMRLAETEAEYAAIRDGLAAAAPQVATRVLLSLREHLMNRETAAPQRLFANQRSRAWATADARKSLPAEVTAPILALVDAAVAHRLPAIQDAHIDADMARVAVPLSQKGTLAGFGGLPRGSVTPVDAVVLRFFVYWRQARYRTDLDLSALVLDDDFRLVRQVSWTNLRDIGGVHSGDLTEAPHGATEMIDITLDQIPGRYLVPQINKYAGEAFPELAECFFGVMARSGLQDGMPFEPSTVRLKADIRGEGNIALPLIFVKQPDGTWVAKWLNLYLKGTPNFNRLEANKVSTALLVRGIVQRRYLTVTDLVGLLPRTSSAPTLYVGLQRPDGVPSDASVRVLTPLNLNDLCA